MSVRAALLLSACLGLACTAVIDRDQAGDAAASGSGPAGNAGTSTGGSACSGSEVSVPKRLVRLTFNQQTTTLSRLFGSELGQSIAVSFEIRAPKQRTFPPLASPREGAVITDSQWQTSDNIAQAVALHVFEHFTEVSGCAQPVSAECGQSFVLELAARAFRHALSDGERSRLLGVLGGVTADGGSVPEAARYGVYAVLEAPQYLYRTELADTLSARELADAISYFLTDGPPDAALSAAADSGALTTAAGLDGEVDRLLALPEVRQNLEAAMFSYFSLADLDHVVIDPSKFPEFTPELRQSMSLEAERFVQAALWSGPLAQLLTARTTLVDARLASIYGVAFPPPGAAVDAAGFAPITLPETRGGLLTLPAFLTARSRPDHPSVVGRGLAVNAALLCVQNPPFPEGLTAQIAAAGTALGSASEREKSVYRMTTSPCSGCHSSFDPYGLSLENFDSIGRYRAADEQGRPIDASVTLPESAGSVTAKGAREMSEALAQSDAFAVCMSKNLLAYALAEGAGGTDSCSSVKLAERLRATDGSFSALVREIVHAKTFSERSPGATP